LTSIEKYACNSLITEKMCRYLVTGKWRYTVSTNTKKIERVMHQEIKNGTEIRGKCQEYNCRVGALAFPIWRYRCGIINWSINTENRQRNKATWKPSIYVVLTTCVYHTLWLQNSCNIMYPRTWFDSEWNEYVKHMVKHYLIYIVYWNVLFVSQATCFGCYIEPSSGLYQETLNTRIIVWYKNYEISYYKIFI
jgi:hypothetical protein